MSCSSVDPDTDEEDCQFSGRADRHRLLASAFTTCCITSRRLARSAPAISICLLITDSVSEALQHIERYAVQQFGLTRRRRAVDIARRAPCRSACRALARHLPLSRVADGRGKRSIWYRSDSRVRLALRGAVRAGNGRTRSIEKRATGTGKTRRQLAPCRRVRRPRRAGSRHSQRRVRQSAEHRVGQHADCDRKRRGRLE